MMTNGHIIVVWVTNRFISKLAIVLTSVSRLVAFGKKVVVIWLIFVEDSVFFSQRWTGLDALVLLLYTESGM